MPSFLRIILTIGLVFIAIGQGICQGVLWQKNYAVPIFSSGSFRESAINNAALHKNGGIVTVGSYYSGTRNRWGRTAHHILRIAANGDSLGRYKLPGFLQAGVLGPSIISRRTDGKFYVLCPTDTVAPFDTLAKPSYIALLDTSGVCLDSFPLLSRSIRYEGIPWNGVQFSDNSAILTAQGYGSDSTKGLFTRFLVWKVRIPEGFVEWFKSIRIHPQINEKPKAVIMPGGKIWVYGVSGANVVLVKLDSLGNQTEVQNLYTTPTSVRPILGSFLPLPDSKIAITVGYNALPPQSGNKPGAQNLIVMDTLGNTVWQISKPIPVTGSSVHGFAQIYGANIDGSINYLHDSTVGGSTYSFLEKRAADSTLLYSWPITTRTGVSATEINGVVYAGNDEAYVYGKGGDFIKGIPGDYVARVTGFGTRFDPTALPGPRARPVPLQAISLYPNPATTSLRIRSEKVLRYSIITPSGAQVQQGVLAPSKAIDIATLPPGLYLLRLQDGAASSVGRFIKN